MEAGEGGWRKVGVCLLVLVFASKATADVLRRQ
jgi:hypothetical protein